MTVKARIAKLEKGNYGGRFVAVFGEDWYQVDDRRLTRDEYDRIANPLDKFVFYDMDGLLWKAQPEK